MLSQAVVVETGCVLIDRQEHRWELEMKGLVGGRVAPDSSVALRQELTPRGKGLGLGEIARS